MDHLFVKRLCFFSKALQITPLAPLKCTQKNSKQIEPQKKMYITLTLNEHKTIMSNKNKEAK